MKKRSTLLKVISIILIISGILGIVSVGALLATQSSMASIYESVGVEAPSTASYIISLAVAASEIAAGILGVMYKSRQNVLIVGVIYTICVLISMVFTAVTTGFIISSLLSLLLPLLYLWGWYQSN